MLSKPNVTVEFSYSGIVVGIDEAGCGPWAGPVVAGAAILNPHWRINRINDSKKLTAEQRDDLYDTIVERAHTGVGIASVEEIDRLNILEATKLAMRRAFDALKITPEIALVDGNRPPRLPCRIKMIIEGDASCLSIAAASIVAKVTRDRIMQQLGAECPGYGWERNAGYGTEEHQQALTRLGITPHHRRSWAPIRALLETDDLFSYMKAETA